MFNEKIKSVIRLSVGIIFSLTFSSTSWSQELTNQEYHQSLENSLRGVFQVQLDNPRLTPMISTDLLEQVRDNQQQSSPVFFDYKSMRVRVISKDEQLTGALIPASQFVIQK